MKLLAVDSNSIMNRAFYGIKLLTTRSGFYTNAVYGFLTIFLATISEVRPDAVVFAFDVPEPTFRHKLFDAYKAGRHRAPDELIAQFPLIKELLRDLGYPILEAPGFEADDILGTLAAACERAGWECVVSTGDRDSLQLVTDKVHVRLASTKMGAPVSTLMGPAEIMETYGVRPEQLIEVKALMGDPSDNIPGVPGVGEKTALDLVARYGSVDDIYKDLSALEIKPGVLKKLEEGRESAYLSRTLGTIAKDAPVPLDPAAYLRSEPDEAAACALLAKLEMYKMPQKLGLDPSKVPAKPQEHAETSAAMTLSAAGPSALAESEKWARAYLLPQAEGDGVAALALSDGETIDLIENDGPAFERALAGFLASDCQKLCDDLKFLCRWADARGAATRRFVMDTGLAGYILNVTGDDYSPEKLSALYGTEKREIGGEIPDPIAGLIADPSSGHEALLDRMASFPSLCQNLQKEIDRNGQNFLLNDIELPLAGVLAEMELRGFEIDPDGLRAYGEELSGSITEAERQVYELAGETFNILSPKQLGKVLFEDLGLPAKKKTKSGYSTGADVLEELRPYHPAIDAILEYRKLTKLRSTYVDGLLAALAPDGRVHTRFNQKETRTGRISSLEPNLQNIPIRSELGSRLRGFFRAKEGSVLIDADYSQIELRVLAHIANDAAMKKAFLTGTDIHTETAAQIFGLPEEFVTRQLRSRAKAVNFGIIYGIGAFSLANNTGVSTAEAKKYIESYLAHYSGVDAYMKRAIEDAKEKGYAETFSGRRRALPELQSSNHNLRAFGERVARNMPIQGAAADIIKLAMVKVSRRLAEEKLDARLILQVHDELIVEAAEADANRAAEILKYEMENAYPISVPLTVEVGTGKTWLEAH